MMAASDLMGVVQAEVNPLKSMVVYVDGETGSVQFAICRGCDFGSKVKLISSL